MARSDIASFLPKKTVAHEKDGHFTGRNIYPNFPHSFFFKTWYLFSKIYNFGAHKIAHYHNSWNMCIRNNRRFRPLQKSSSDCLQFPYFNGRFRKKKVVHIISGRLVSSGCCVPKEEEEKEENGSVTSTGRQTDTHTQQGGAKKLFLEGLLIDKISRKLTRL